MARDNRELKAGREVKSRQAAPDDAARPSPWQRTRLTTMPLAVLLPQLSDVGVIAEHRDELQDRLKGLQDQAEIGEPDEPGSLQVEQSMLQQVLQWLDVETDEG